MLNILASLQAELGKLSWIRSFVKPLVFVHCVDTFAEHHLAADGRANWWPRCSQTTAAMPARRSA
jgi:hypothetical protein